MFYIDDDWTGETGALRPWAIEDPRVILAAISITALNSERVRHCVE